jgi:hypothetical protein
MPSRWYKRNLRAGNNSQKQHNPIIILQSNKGILTQSGILTIKRIEQDVYKIIDSITIRMEIEKVLELATNFHTTIKTRQDAYDLIQEIEEIVLGIIDNIAGRIDLGIVTCRIQYLKDLIAKMDSTCCINYDGPFADMILEIFTMLGKAVDLDGIQSAMQSVYSSINKSVKNEEYIREAEQIIIGIFQNVSDRVDLGIVTCRIQYLQDLITKIDKDCILYNTLYSQEIINIIGLISKIGQTADIIIELQQIEGRIQLLHTVISKKVDCLNVIKESETMILSIIQNMTDRVDLGIVTCRLQYLQGILQKVQEF